MFGMDAILLKFGQVDTQDGFDGVNFDLAPSTGAMIFTAFFSSEALPRSGNSVYISSALPCYNNKEIMIWLL